MWFARVRHAASIRAFRLVVFGTFSKEGAVLGVITVSFGLQLTPCRLDERYQPSAAHRYHRRCSLAWSELIGVRRAVGHREVSRPPYKPTLPLV
jgi:hypothetical protein